MSDAVFLLVQNNISHVFDSFHRPSHLRWRFGIERLSYGQTTFVTDGRVDSWINLHMSRLIHFMLGMLVTSCLMLLAFPHTIPCSTLHSTTTSGDSSALLHELPQLSTSARVNMYHVVAGSFSYLDRSAAAAMQVLCSAFGLVQIPCGPSKKKDKIQSRIRRRAKKT